MSTWSFAMSRRLLAHGVLKGAWRKFARLSTTTLSHAPTDDGAWQITK